MQRANAGCKRAAGSGARRALGEDSTVAGPIRVTRKLGRAAQLLFQHPLQRFALVAFVVGSYLWVQKHPDCANQPMLPVVRDDNCDAICFLLVIFYEPSMISKGCNILPAACRFHCVGRCSVRHYHEAVTEVLMNVSAHERTMAASLGGGIAPAASWRSAPAIGSTGYLVDGLWHGGIFYRYLIFGIVHPEQRQQWLRTLQQFALAPCHGVVATGRGPGLVSLRVVSVDMGHFLKSLARGALFRGWHGLIRITYLIIKNRGVDASPV